MNISSLRYFFSLLIISVILSQSVAQTGNPLLLKTGNRTPVANLVQWQQAFSVQSENLFGDRFYKVIQFETIPSEATKQQLAESGIHLLSYLPVNAYFASLSATINPANLSGKGIRAITALTPDERIAPTLHENTLPVYAIRGNNRIEVVVTVYSDVDAITAGSHLQGFDWEMVRITGAGRIIHLILPFGELYTLASQPFVQFVEPCDPPAEPDNSRGRTLHRATTAFNPEAGLNDYDGTGVRVMINDDGYIGNHIDFTNRIPYQFTQSTGQDHGDHCAGTILGAGNLNPLAMGMAPAADLVVYSASNYPGFDSIFTQYQSLGIRLTSTSYSDGCNAGYTNRTATMDEQIRTMPELMHIFSAGNNGTQNCSYGAGSGWGNITGGHKMGKNVIAVANVTYKDELANSSSRGPAHDGRIKPDVSALGTNVFSTSENNTYATKTGTSMACPGTTGTLALLYDAYNRHHGGNPHGGLMKSILMNTADDLGNPGPDFKFGYGRINAGRAGKVIKDTLWHTDLISQGDSLTYNLTVPAGTKDLRIMLYWTDYEGVVNTTKALVNDLDLRVIAPDSTWLPWVLNHLPNATTLNANATRKNDTLNNAEQITLVNPTSGTYQLKIYGTTVPMGPQRFFVSWLITPEEFTVTYPHEGSQFVPGETEVIRWDALPTATTFQLDYTTNSGSTWNSIATAIAAEDRYFDWTVPALAAGNIQVRLTSGTQTFTTAPFTIMPVPQGITINWVCMDSLKLTWSPVSAATGYEILKLGSLYMDSIAYTTSNTIILTGIPHNTEEWFSVRAYGPSDAKGRRANAIFRTPGLANCVYNYDLALQEITDPKPVILSGCYTNPTQQIRATIKNNGSSPITGFTVNYSMNLGPVVTETITTTLQPNQTLQHTFATPATLGGVGDYLFTVWANTLSDQFPFNDTLTQLITVANFPVIQIPFMETFENFPICPTSNGCSQINCTLDAGWLNPDNTRFDGTDWITHRGATPSFGTGPSGDHTTGTTSGKFLYLEASNCFQNQGHLISPCIDLTNASIPVLSYWYHMYGTGMGSMRLDVLADGIWIENYAPVVQGNQGTSWKNRMVPLSDFNGKIINLRFRGTIGNDYMSDMCLDDISVVETVGIQPEEQQNMISLQPNPATDQVILSGISLTGSPVQAEFFNQHGQLVLKHIFIPGTGTYQESVPLHNLSPGVHMVRITGTELTVTKKLVITR
ncbi:MAG: S8 family serine peptidase [Bacteroidales bacterium]